MQKWFIWSWNVNSEMFMGGYKTEFIASSYLLEQKLPDNLALPIKLLEKKQGWRFKHFSEVIVKSRRNLQGPNSHITTKGATNNVIQANFSEVQ